MNGKGDKDRSTYTQEFKENFDKIEWRERKKKYPPIQIKKEKGKTTYVYK